MRGPNVAAEALRSDDDNEFSEKDSEPFPATTLLRNSASGGLGAYFKSIAVQSPARRGGRPEYRARRHQDDTTGRPRTARQGFPVIKGSLTKREKVSPKIYGLHRAANTVLRPGICLRPSRPLRRKGAFDTHRGLPVYRKRQSAFLRAPARVGDVVKGAEREQAEFMWLSLNRREYAGRWVALDGGTLLAVGDSAREVYVAIANHRRPPLVTRVETEDEPYFAGW